MCFWTSICERYQSYSIAFRKNSVQGPINVKISWKMHFKCHFQLSEFKITYRFLQCTVWKTLSGFLGKYLCSLCFKLLVVKIFSPFFRRALYKLSWISTVTLFVWVFGGSICTLHPNNLPYIYKTVHISWVKNSSLSKWMSLLGCCRISIYRKLSIFKKYWIFNFAVSQISKYQNSNIIDQWGKCLSIWAKTIMQNNTDMSWILNLANRLW